jgi:hypothetical protein
MLYGLKSAPAQMPAQRAAVVYGLGTMMDVFVGFLDFAAAPAPARILVLTFMIFLSW